MKNIIPQKMIPSILAFFIVLIVQTVIEINYRTSISTSFDKSEKMIMHFYQGENDWNSSKDQPGSIISNQSSYFGKNIKISKMVLIIDKRTYC